MRNEVTFDLIQKPVGTLDILVYLSRQGPSDVTTIIKDLNMCTKTFYSATDRLKSLGLVFEEERTGWPTRVLYQLTFKGEDAVKNLLPLEVILLESIEAKKEELRELESARKTKTNKKRRLAILRGLQDTTFDLGEWEETLRLSEKAIDLASSIKDERSLLHAHLIAGLVQQKRSDVAESRENLERSLEISTRIGEWDSSAEVHYILGALYERTGEMESAMVQYRKSMDCSERADWWIGESRARLGVGRVLGRRGKYEESLEEIQQAVKEFEDMEATNDLARAYGALGATTFYLDKEKALEYHEKSILASRKTGEVRLRAMGLTNASACYAERGEFKKALDYLEEAEDILTKLDDKPLMGGVLLLRGSIQGKRGKWKDSESSFQKSIDIFEKASADYHLADALFHYGQMLMDRSETRRSRSVLEKALAIFERFENESKIGKVRKALESVTQ
jgi:tetratricopeptide (TPR) repeat protein